jgi:Helix-turn-helix domain
MPIADRHATAGGAENSASISLSGSVVRRTGGHGKAAESASATFNSGRYRWLSMIVGDRKLTAAALRVAIMIFQRINMQKGYAWPSQAYLASVTGTSKRSVIRAVNLLHERGWIERRRSTKRGRSNEYRLAFGKLDDGDEG